MVHQKDVLINGLQLLHFCVVKLWTDLSSIVLHYFEEILLIRPFMLKNIKTDLPMG